MTTWTFDGVGLPDGLPLAWRAGTGPAAPLPGRFALTGLVDAHCHLTVDVDDQGPFLGGGDLARQRLEDGARDGVTAVRDVGGAREITLRLAAAPVDGLPQVQAAGRFLAPTGRYIARLHDPVEAPDLVAAVRAEVAAGAQWVKIVGDFPEERGVPGSPILTSYDEATVAAAVEAAHQAGARVAAHLQGRAASQLVAAGVDSVEHGPALTEDDVDALGARGGAWTPTLCAVLGPPPDDEHAAGGAPHTGEVGERYRALLPRAVEAGVRVLVGTDVVGTLVGEVRQLVAHGLEVEQALRALTTDAQEYLGAGDRLDLVTFEGDPRDDPRLLASPAAVVLRGRRVR